MPATPLESVQCPYCGSESRTHWAVERGFATVRCTDCSLLYCNPRPVASLIDASVRTGTHGEQAGGLVVVERRVPQKVGRYRRVFAQMFADIWSSGGPVSWLDIGAGYGEVLEAVHALAPPGSALVGLEPMHPKAVKARERGLTIIEDYLRPGTHKVDVVSVVDVFSHIPDFSEFLDTVRGALNPSGNVFLETGNLADLGSRSEFPGELGLPDHLVFAGERHVVGYLQKAGFEVTLLRRERIDSGLYFVKNVIKKLIGRPAVLRPPYTSAYRSLQVRARLRR